MALLAPFSDWIYNVLDISMDFSSGTSRIPVPRDTNRNRLPSFGHQEVRMKKNISLFLVLLLALSVFVACSVSKSDVPDQNETEKEQASPIDSLNTIGDVLELTKGSCQSAIGEGKVIFAFEYNGSYYRVTAAISEKDQADYNGLDFFDEDYEAKGNAIISPLKIDKVECLDDQKLNSEEMEAFIGKTGQDLMDAGWHNDSGYNLETMEFWMSFKSFEYTVVFDGTIDESEYENFDSEEGIRALVVKSLAFEGLGNATDSDME